ncbi:HAD family hydrolase [Sediminitomix flava]|uniref:HAD superfamily hydrolase (TIGR01509 family) n=1 Tax=Sediminitomix flava TaxID=379075 RepID=A0A315ZDW0_SEDFL|nr:HAD family phosphatase [Sediminitomix flava]PWJ43806.1 hypothetical protein BC781_101152 [Sediminitomix flava]
MIINRERASGLVMELSEQYAKVQNPEFVFPPFELYPLAPKAEHGVDMLKAVVMDMDGTTTTTEELCLYSLEYMVRKLSARMTKEEWEGLDHVVDFPHIIGNSTTKHVEYLIDTYESSIREEEIYKSFIYAAIWTLTLGKDENRKEEVKINLAKTGIAGKILSHTYLAKMEEADQLDMGYLAHFEEDCKADFKLDSKSSLVAVAVDIYYQKYHEILRLISEGKGQQVQLEVFGESGGDKHLIEPMEGIGILLPMLRGWLGEDIKYLVPTLIENYENKSGEKFEHSSVEELTAQLVELSLSFEKTPAKVGLVTSSIFYEAEIVIKEVFAVVQKQLQASELPTEKKDFLIEKFSDYRNIYESFVTASLTHEIRLKPHRDLYSIALYQLGIAPEDFDKVAGFEDSQSGMVAIRAAGIGLCIAVPFAQSLGHNMEAASHICKGGVPEALLKHNLFTQQTTATV